MKIDLNNKKSIIIGIVIAIVLIALIIGICFIVNNNSESKITKLYNKLESMSKYSFRMNQNDGYTIIMAKKDNINSIDMQSEDMHTTTLLKEEGTYFINHDEKLYSLYTDTATNENILLEELKKVKNIEKTTGREKIDNKTYYYEEYKGYSGFMYSSNIGIEDENIVTRFYFSGNDIKYIKTIITDEEQELIKVELTDSPDDSLFDIPEGYTEM